MEQSNSRTDVIQFINRFTDNGRRTEVIDAFTSGCCYWFARILRERFICYYPSIIVYAQIDNHFGCRIGGEVYDITGIVTNQRSWEPWKDVVMSDENLASYIARDCINF